MVDGMASTDLALVARRLHVNYRLYDDGSRSLRRLVASGFRSRQYRLVEAVKGVDFSLRRGEAVGIIGRNGSGKSTLLRALAGLMPATAGSVHARTVPVLLGVGSVLQSDLSCYRNIVLGSTALGLTRKEALARTGNVLDFAGLADFGDMPFRALSSGMRARLQFAIATSVIPDILMIDETLAVGDAEFRAKSEARMAEVLEQSASVVLVSHSMALLRSVCSRIVWLDRGTVRGDGSPADVIGAYEHDVRSRAARAASS